MRSVLSIALACALSSAVTASAQDDFSAVSANPYSPLVRGHLYAQLYKSPLRAGLYEALVPGLGFAYAGFTAQALASALTSAASLGVLIGGAVADKDVVFYTGIGALAASRAYGIAGAPLSATALNAAFRRHLGLTLAYAF
jgi:hypothetical protein